MPLYLKAAKARGDVVHVVENGQALCGSGIKKWDPQPREGYTCGLCGSKWAKARNTKTLNAPRLFRGDAA